MTDWRALPALGVGIGFREPLRGDLFRCPQEVDFLEITADHYFDASRDKLRELDLLAEHFTLIPHALGLSIGSAEGIDRAYLAKLAALVRRLHPPWWSEHLAMTRAGGVDIGHLAPVPRTRESLAVLARNLDVIRQAIDVPLILENITYSVRLPRAEMSEAQFLCEVAGAGDCGLLLDVTNLHANAQNHGYDSRAFLDGLPLDAVVQLHFVGYQEDASGQILDIHAGPTQPPVWDLMDEILGRAPVKGAILERDEKIPPLAELLPELRQAREIGRRHGRWA
jgi:uncharacterized protein